MKLDTIDTTILSELTMNARASQVELAERVGLSSTAIARRQKVLEEEGFIRGYQAVLDLTRFGLSTTVLVRVTLESQNEDALKSFEAAVIDCPSVVRCFLMSGSDDYIVIVMARDIEDFERIHRTELSPHSKMKMPHTQILLPKSSGCCRAEFSNSDKYFV